MQVYRVYVKQLFLVSSQLVCFSLWTLFQGGLTFLCSSGPAFFRGLGSRPCVLDIVLFFFSSGSFPGMSLLNLIMFFHYIMDVPTHFNPFGDHKITGVVCSHQFLNKQGNSLLKRAHSSAYLRMQQEASC